MASAKRSISTPTAPIAADQSLLLNAAQAAKALGLGRTKFFQLKAADQLPEPVNLGSDRPLWRRADLEAWVKQLGTAPGPQRRRRKRTRPQHHQGE